jgi:hypothetical protein
VFLEPIQWMGDQVVGPVQGKLYCPNCTARLGSFNWAGGCCRSYICVSKFIHRSKCCATHLGIQKFWLRLEVGGVGVQSL